MCMRLFNLEGGGGPEEKVERGGELDKNVEEEWDVNG